MTAKNLEIQTWNWPSRGFHTLENPFLSGVSRRVPALVPFGLSFPAFLLCLAFGPALESSGKTAVMVNSPFHRLFPLICSDMLSILKCLE